jgi:hypothetical protein
MQKHTTKLRFTDADLANEKVRKAAEKAEKAVDKADGAKARLPSRKLRTKTTAASAEGAKLRFGKKEFVAEEIKKPRPVAAKATAKSAAASMSGTVHKQATEYQDDNVGVQAVNETNGAAETAVQTADTVHYSHKLKSYNRAAKLESKADRANVEALYQKVVAVNPEKVSSNPISRWRQKQAIRKEYAAIKAGQANAGAAASSAVHGGAGAAKTAGKAVKEGRDIGTLAANFVKSHSHVLLIAGGLLMIILIVAGSISSCSVFMNGGTNVVIDTSYTAEDADILGAEEDYADLESALQTRIDNIRSEYDGYDEYNITCDQIGHNPYELASYLTVTFENYKRNEVQGALQDLFDSQYELTIEEVVETRYRTETRESTSTDPETGEETTDTYEVEVPYDYYILNVTLKNRSMGTAINESGLDEDSMQRYAILMQTYGNKPEIFAGNPNAIQVQDVLHYDIPGEALTDEKFRKMITEAEKYLGYPYVWGGASPSTSFDCSGFVSWVLNHCGNGWSYGRLTAEGLRQVCRIIPKSEAKPGDLIFFQGTYNTSGASHVGIYVGNGMMIHCGNPIQYASTETSYWQQHFYCIGRLP